MAHQAPLDSGTLSQEFTQEFTPDSGGDNLAKQVNEKVSQNLLDDAYKTLKSGVNSSFSDKPLSEKQEFWGDVSKSLEESGALTKLSAVFLEDISKAVAGSDGKIQRSELAGVSSSKNPMYSGLASQAMKEFDIAASLSSNDGVIDMQEIADYKLRQTMPDTDKYTDLVLKNLTRKLAESPGEAMKYLSQSMAGRARLETPEESQKTWTQLAEKLNAHGLVEPLSMAFLRLNNNQVDMNKNESFSLSEVQRFQQSRNPIMKQFADHIVKDFANIATIDYKLDEISQNEATIYERKKIAPSDK
ncbi:MAG: hypothetical protein K8F91_00835 [Candidatus Obscuribacterales bacterium]|nr:hypothetical protein [Candidatus Obscuribacterales bacterium]